MKALISVSDKEGVVDFARELVSLGVEILSTGGTARAIKEAGVAVKDVSEYTGFPEMMDGRVKTLHPKVHGGLLAIRENEDHMAQAKANGVDMIDIVVVNLYPFKQTIAKEGVAIEEAIENIDIGGPTMLRSAAKNYKYVTVITDPSDYAKVTEELKEKGNTSIKTRERLAVKVFNHTADYDSAIDTYLSEKLNDEKKLRLKYVKGTELRYGENWHQKAKLYLDENCDESNVPYGEVLHGKAMSYNNYVDADGSFESVKELKDTCGVSVIKHTNPCGLATGATMGEAMRHAWEGDIVSAFGSVISCTRKVDLETAEFLKGKFVEAVIAPDFEDDALEFLKNKSKNLRLIKVKDLNTGKEDKKVYKHVIGGMLEQGRDSELFEKFECVTKEKLPDSKKKLAEFAFKAVKHTKSNAIMICHEYKEGQFMVMGMGAGQPNRVDAVRKLAVVKAKENITRIYGEEKVAEIMKECVLASDAFFPFDDNIVNANEHGIKYIVQPGGSVKDEEVISKCDELGMGMIFTGMRHFMH